MLDENDICGIIKQLTYSVKLAELFENVEAVINGCNDILINLIEFYELTYTATTTSSVAADLLVLIS